MIVKAGDTVNLELTAVDANYAFTQPQYRFNDPIAKGKTQTVQFQASQVGNFTFYCAIMRRAVERPRRASYRDSRID